MLTLNGGDPEYTPTGIIRSLYYNPREWLYIDNVISANQSGSFALLPSSHINLDIIRAGLERKRATIPEGQWLRAFKAAFPRPDGEGPIGIAFPSWTSSKGKSMFPFIDTKGGESLYLAERQLNNSIWRWLVRIS